MRKKYLSALLFGALLFASTATFTSCKDYDDDIANLQEQVDKVVTDIKTLQDAAGKYVTSVVYDATTGKLTVTGGNGETYQLPMPEELPTYALEVNDGKIYLKENGSVISEATLPQSPEVTVPDAFNPELLAWGNDGYLYYGTTKVDGVQKPVFNASITEVKDDAEVIGYLITIGEDSATFYVKSELKSLVFEPDLYLEGIEGTRYRYLSGAFIEPTGTATGTYNGVSFKVTEKNEFVVPAVPVSYALGRTETIDFQMNPSNADVEDASLSFEYLAAETVSRAAGVSVDYVSHKTENGDLLVDYKIQNPDLLETTDAKVSVMSLKTELPETKNEDAKTINSDYAAIVPAVVTLENLAFVDIAVDNDSHLYTTGADAVKSDEPRTVYVQYNAGTYDLSNEIEVHFLQNDFTAATAGTHQTMTYDEVEKYGLHFEYEMLKYTTGDHNTQEDMYGAINNDGIFTPMYVDKDGNKVACGNGTEEGISAVGREPIVIVKLCDANSNVLLAGYVKIHISKKVDINPIFVKDFGTTGYLCSGITENINWADMSGKIVEAVQMTKEEFFDAYTIDEVSSTPTDVTAQTYVDVTQTGSTIVSGNIYGDLILNLDHLTNPSTVNDIFTWKADFTEMDRIYNLPGHTQTLWVKFVSKSDPQDIVYLGYSVTVAERPEVVYGEKSLGAWYGTAQDTVRMNVPYPNSTTLAITQYVKDLDDYFKDGAVKVSYKNGTTPEGYGAIATLNPEYEYVFENTTCGTASDVINLIASATGKSISYRGTVIAEIVGNEIHYQNNNVAKELLNKYAHDVPNFFANVKIVSDYCDVAATGHQRISFRGEEKFKVRFQRPVDIKDNDNATLVDAAAAGSTVKIINLIGLSDWRDKLIIDNSNNAVLENGVNLFDFYGFTSIKFDLNNAQQNHTTDGGVFESISRAPQIDLSIVDAGGNAVSANTVSIFGINDLKNNYLRYANNQGNVKDFKLRIPVELTYSCGTIKVIVECDIDGTLAN